MATVLACHGITKAFGTDVIVRGVTFAIEEREKVAMVGVNGAGKTTLFRIITGELAADDGQVVVAQEARLGYLEQIATVSEENTIYEETLTVFDHLAAMEAEMRLCEECMGQLTGGALEDAMPRYARLSQEFEHRRGYEYKSRARGVIKGLGFTEEEFNQPMGQLSGGQKTRVNLGKLMLTEPDVLLLDEPTNHLDIDAVQWLEDYLRDYRGAVVVISHDRYFLDRMVNTVIEIENRKGTVYKGNYHAYTEKKEVERNLKLKHYFDQQKEIKRQEEVIQTLRSYNREKSIKRAESRQKLLDKIERVEKPESLPDKMRITLTPKRESGNDVLLVKNTGKRFADDPAPLFSGLSFALYKGDRAAVVGPNGIGKTTLIKIIAGAAQATEGSVQTGTGVVMGYYDQEHQNLDADKTIFEEISDTYPRLTNGEIRNVLAAFVFTGDDVFKPIATLSGGERGRVALAKLMLGGANFLILDEPTNHLDMYSKEILEEALRNYPGTVLYISHDRYFINRTATRVLAMSAGGLTNYPGNYDDYLERKQWERQQAQPAPGAGAEDAGTGGYGKNDWAEKKEAQANERKRKNRLSRVEKEIETLEAELQATDELLAEASADHERAAALYESRQGLANALEALYAEWEALAEEAGE